MKEAIEKNKKIDVVKAEQYTVAQWCRLWHENYCKPNVGVTMAKYYRNYTENHIVPAIGNIKLCKLTTLDLQQFYNQVKTSGRVKKYDGMKDRSLSVRTVRGLHTMLHICLDQAVQERLIPYNPAAKYRLPPKEKKEMQIIPPQKIGAYLRAAEGHGVLPMFYLELTTGLRRGELAALLWTDLDMKVQTLSVSKSVGRFKGKVKVTQPKTANSVRTIYLPKETVDLLVQEHKKYPFNPYNVPFTGDGQNVWSRLRRAVAQDPAEESRDQRKHPLPRSQTPVCQAHNKEFLSVILNKYSAIPAYQRVFFPAG